MSRIRSIHPGLWTDEEFVSVSCFARLFFMGLWNECDDKGIFQWSPLKMKMRILPADNCDAGALLGELESVGLIRKYEISGKNYGAVKNFSKFQRPKKPNDIHPETAEISEFCGRSAEPKEDKQPPVTDQLPTGGENPPQREEGGDKGNKEKNKKENIDFEEIKSRWNKINGVKECRVFDKRRKAAVKARVAEYGLDAVWLVFDTIANSRFHCGGGPDGWRADIGHAFQASSFLKHLEGAPKAKGRAEQPMSDEEWDAFCDERAEQLKASPALAQEWLSKKKGRSNVVAIDASAEVKRAVAGLTH